jgi:hypothetical protein
LSDTNKLRAALDRPITQQESEIVRWLLDHGDPRYFHLASQIDSLRVISKCTCGCPTVDFALKSGETSRKGGGPVSDNLATVDDQLVGVMLFACNDSLSSLEVYSMAGNDKPFDLPNIEDLFPWEDLSKHRDVSSSRH